MSTTLHHVCPYCLTEHDEVSDIVGKAAPTKGDAGICFDCGEVFTFDGDGGVRLPTETEAAAYRADDRLMSARALMLPLIRARMKNRSDHADQ